MDELKNSDTLTELDLSLIAELHENLFCEVGETKKSFFSHIKRPETKLFSHMPKGYALITVANDEIVLGWLGVARQFRRQGVASKIINEIYLNYCADAISRVPSSLFANVQPQARAQTQRSLICYCRERFQEALNFYLAIGFESISRFKGIDGDEMIKFKYLVK
jgi:GNAT superfamily N-acetyltransferase